MLISTRHKTTRSEHMCVYPMLKAETSCDEPSTAAMVRLYSREPRAIALEFDYWRFDFSCSHIDQSPFSLLSTQYVLLMSTSDRVLALSAAAE